MNGGSDRTSESKTNGNNFVMKTELWSSAVTYREDRWWGVHRRGGRLIYGRRYGRWGSWQGNRVRRRVRRCQSWNRRKRRWLECDGTETVLGVREKWEGLEGEGRRNGEEGDGRWAVETQSEKPFLASGKTPCSLILIISMKYILPFLFLRIKYIL